MKINGTLTNADRINNSGIINNDGTLINSYGNTGFFQNTGTINNNGMLETTEAIDGASGTFINGSEATLYINTAGLSSNLGNANLANGDVIGINGAVIELEVFQLGSNFFENDSPLYPPYQSPGVNTIFQWVDNFDGSNSGWISPLP
jgi:hypothetical protein